MKYFLIKNLDKFRVKKSFYQVGVFLIIAFYLIVLIGILFKSHHLKSLKQKNQRVYEDLVRSVGSLNELSAYQTINERLHLFSVENGTSFFLSNALFLNQLQEWISQNSLELYQLHPLGNDASNEQLYLKVGGKYEDIIEMLSQMIKSVYLFQIQAWKLSLDEREKIILEITLETFA